MKIFSIYINFVFRRHINLFSFASFCPPLMIQCRNGCCGETETPSEEKTAFVWDFSFGEGPETGKWRRNGDKDNSADGKCVDDRHVKGIPKTLFLRLLIVSASKRVLIIDIMRVAY